MRRAALLAGVALALPAAAHAAQPPGSYQVGSPPAVCAGSLFTDVVLTDADDTGTASFAATRLWGLAGDDILAGSPTRATCMFGGRGDDRLIAGTGGGVSYGELGEDTLVGSPISDALVGGADVDSFAGGEGDDAIDSRDGNAEVVDCGAGDDTVTGDRADVLIGCETAHLTGRRLPVVRNVTAKVGTHGVPKLRWRVPRSGGAGDFRVLLVTGRPAAATPGCTGGPVELARFPRKGDPVRRGQAVKVGLRPPKGGYCRGAQKAVVLYALSVDGPAEPVARLGFRVGG